MKLSRPITAFQTSGPILLAALMAFGAAACESTGSKSQDASQPPTQAAAPSASKPIGRVDLSNDLTTQASVVSVDSTKRLITLRRENGNMITVQAGPEVRNFSQIAVGDQLRVRYHESLSATKLPSGSTTTPTEGAFAAGRSKAGEKPAGGIGVAATVRVKIESIDAANGIVVFSLDSGELSTVRAARPEGREFIKNLKVGDIVQLDYTESLALSIEKL